MPLVDISKVSVGPMVFIQSYSVMCIVIQLRLNNILLFVDDNQHVDDHRRTIISPN